MKQVVKLEGSTFKSKPYRFLIQNGNFVVLETEWSTFINPWTKKLEFLIGYHRVLKGPADPDIFCETDKLNKFSKEVMKESSLIQKDILALLKENIQRGQKVEKKVDVGERCKDLKPIIMNLLEEIKISENTKDPVTDSGSSMNMQRSQEADNLKPMTTGSLKEIQTSGKFKSSPMDNGSFSEHESVILQGISPYHDSYGSQSSTGTPPSYNQLNYYENLDRFFNSKLEVTGAYGSEEDNANVSSGDDARKNYNNSSERKYMSPNEENGLSASDSAENLSSGSNNQRNFNTNSNEMATNNLIPPILTKFLLNKHNEDMKKVMFQKHKELKSIIKKCDKESKLKNMNEKSTEPKLPQCKGIKRCRSYSREKNHKKSKNNYSKMCTIQAVKKEFNNDSNRTDVHNTSKILQNNTNKSNWSPLAVTMPHTIPVQTCITNQNSKSQAVPTMPLISSIVPLYYIPMAQNPNPSFSTKQDTNTEKLPPASVRMMQHRPSLSYATTGLPSLFYSSILTSPVPISTISRKDFDPKSELNERAPKLPPAEIPKKVKTLELLNFCNGNGSITANTFSSKTESPKQNEFNVDESSTSSFYSSFISKSCESNCNSRQTQNFHEEVHQKKQPPGVMKKEPSCMENFQLTPELIYQYKVPEKSLTDVLQADMEALKDMSQPSLVSEQLNQLYCDLELEGLDTTLKLEDDIDYDGSFSDIINGGKETLFHS